MRNVKEVYDPEIERFVVEHYVGRTTNEVQKMIFEKFGVNEEIRRIRLIARKHGLKSGVNMQFGKRQPSAKKGIKFKNKGQFQKGQKPHNFRDVGSERVDNNGITEIKVTNDSSVPIKSRWRKKHSVIWEQMNGMKIPEGHVIMFADGDRQNFTKENLICVSRAELMFMNKNGLVYKDAELTKTGLLIARLHLATLERKKK